MGCRVWKVWVREASRRGGPVCIVERCGAIGKGGRCGVASDISSYHDVSRTVREAKDHRRTERLMDVSDRTILT